MKHIKKFESIRDKMTPKSEEEIINNLNDENKLVYEILKLSKIYWEDKGIVFDKEYSTEEFSEQFKDGDVFFRMYMTSDGIVTPTKVTIDLEKDDYMYVILIGDVKYKNGNFFSDQKLLKNEVDFKNFML